MCSTSQDFWKDYIPIILCKFNLYRKFWFTGDDESCDTQETGKSQSQLQSQQQQSQMQQKGSGMHGQCMAVLFPSCLCSAVVDIIGLLDDAAVSADGNSVYEVAYQVINCRLPSSIIILYI